MPVFHRRFLHPETKKQSAEHLRNVGPRLPVEVGVTDLLAASLSQSGTPVPPPHSGYALVDTGASVTAVDEEVLQGLEISPISTIQLSTPGGTQTRYLYPAKLVFPGTPLPPLEFAALVGVSVKDQGYLALIGRDILQNMVMVYDGSGYVLYAF
jgi:predicted aspartyl protease